MKSAFQDTTNLWHIDQFSREDLGGEPYISPSFGKDKEFYVAIELMDDELEVTDTNPVMLHLYYGPDYDDEYYAYVRWSIHISREGGGRCLFSLDKTIATTDMESSTERNVTVEKLNNFYGSLQVTCRVRLYRPSFTVGASKFLWNDKMYCDTVINTRDGCSINAHKIVLSSVAYFQTMFKNNDRYSEDAKTDDKNNQHADSTSNLVPGQKRLRLDDSAATPQPSGITMIDFSLFSEHSVKEMLEFIYMGAIREPSFELESCFELLRLADYTLYTELLDLVSNLISTYKITDETIAEIYTLAVSLNENGAMLKKKCEEYIVERCQVLRKSEEFMKSIEALGSKVLMDILSLMMDQR